jgi:hypothetical protein
LLTSLTSRPASLAWSVAGVGFTVSADIRYTVALPL